MHPQDAQSLNWRLDLNVQAKYQRTKKHLSNELEFIYQRHAGELGTIGVNRPTGSGQWPLGWQWPTRVYIATGKLR